MKTAISIPDDLFTTAEKTAKKMGIARSQLFTLALEEFIQRHNKNSVLDKLNKVYSKNLPKSKTSIDKISVQALRKSLKNDSW